MSPSTSASAWTRNITGPDGGLAATANQNGAVTLQLPNTQGDIAATAANTTAATGITTYNEDTEYGAPRSPSSAPTTYGWLGTKLRSTADLGGFTLMGVRLYDSATGRFLSADPVYCGNSNAYTYPPNPIAQQDPSGQAWIYKKHHTRAYKKAITEAHKFINWAAELRAGGSVADIVSDGLGELFPAVGVALSALGAAEDYIADKFSEFGDKVLSEATYSRKHKSKRGSIRGRFRVDRRRLPILAYLGIRAAHECS